MSERFHIIITSENGRSKTLQLSKKKFYLTATIVITSLVAICTFGYFTTGSYLSNKMLTGEVDTLRQELTNSEAVGFDYAEQVVALQKEHAEIIISLKDTHETLLVNQKMEFDLENTNLQLENVRLMSTAVSDLNQRSELIESVMGSIGVELKKAKPDKSQTHSGGPFIPVEETSYDDLMQQVDDYLSAVRAMPLGKPISGSISSRFGKRIDPVNQKKAFHEGVDIRGKRGDKIRATASGKVIKAFKNSGYGNYVEISHGNGYITAYGHMQNYLVKKGEFVEQGQVIGQVGSSGRSTGPHLHYEIRLNKKLINPATFMKVADLTHTFSAIQE